MAGQRVSSRGGREGGRKEGIFTWNLAQDGTFTTTPHLLVERLLPFLLQLWKESLFNFWDKVLLCSPGWDELGHSPGQPWTHDPLPQASMLVWQAWTTLPSRKTFFSEGYDFSYLSFKVWTPDNLETWILFMEKYFKPSFVLIYNRKRMEKNRRERWWVEGWRNCFRTWPKGCR